MPDAQWSDSDQMADETFKGNAVDYTRANTMNPRQDVETRDESTKND